MSNAKFRLVSGVLTNWMAAGASMIVGFLLAPFLVTRLGEASYGLWVLIGAAVSCMGLLDLGLRGGVMRFVAKGHAQGRHDESVAAVAAALRMRLWIGGGILTIAVVLAAAFPLLFVIAPAARRSTQFALLLSASNLAISMVCGVFGAVLGALNRFNVLSGILILQTIARAISAVYVVSSGYSIAGLALSDFAVSMAANAATVLAGRYCYPELRGVLSSPNTGVMRELWNWSSYSFVINLSGLVIVQSDNIVVGAFVSTTAVTFFAVAGSLVQYTRDFVAAMTTTFAPLASRLDAQARQDDLRRLLTIGTAAALIVALPVMVTLYIRGGTFLGLWLGPHFTVFSGMILQVLLIGHLPRVANATGLGIAFGTDSHRPVAAWSAAEAILNLALSLLLVQWMGTMGVAWGTTIPSLLVNLVLWPPYVCRLVGISTWTYVRQAWLRPLLPAIPFAVVTWYIERAYPPHSILVFFLQVGMALPTFLVALAITYRFEAMQALRLAWNGGDQIVERSPLGSNGKGTLPERSVPARAPMLSRTSPLVSIGVPVYNGERFLARTLDSLQSQTFTDFELIISDNASTDATEEIARSYAARDSRIRYVRNDTNIGAARNFNRVVGLATAPFFKLANADDLAAPELLEACVAELQQNPAAVLVFGHTILIDEDDRHLGIYPDDLHLYQASPSRRLMHFVEHVGQVNALQGVCRRSVLAAVGFSDTWVGADMVLLAKLALAGHFIWLDQPLLFRRMHRAAFSSLPTADHRQAFEDPTVAATTLNRWRILYGYGGAVRTAALPPAEKAAAFGVLVRWTIRNRVNLLGEVRAALRPQS